MAQNIMFDAAPPSWAVWMPAHGAVRLLIDGAFTPTFAEAGGLILALAWLLGLTAAAAASSPHFGGEERMIGFGDVH